jgi:hypothetical protein
MVVFFRADLVVQGVAPQQYLAQVTRASELAQCPVNGSPAHAWKLLTHVLSSEVPGLALNGLEHLAAGSRVALEDLCRF